MAASRYSNILVFATMLAALATSVSAKEFVVGDGNGWTLNFDYQSWAEGKEFFVGDKLVFNYSAGKHNVLRVNGTAFQQCDISSPNGVLASGEDMVTLLTSGRKWYICGVAKHCEVGKMKLVINVLPQQITPAPSPSMTSGTRKLTPPRFYGLVAIFLGALLMILV